MSHEKFEAAYSAAYPIAVRLSAGELLRRNAYGEYQNVNVQIAWALWLAGRAELRAAVVERLGVLAAPEHFIETVRSIT
jgi:hypothetical protein